VQLELLVQQAQLELLELLVLQEQLVQLDQRV
jgi:hypothetical protein